MPTYPNAVESLRCLAGESEPDAAEALNEAADVMADLIAALKLIARSSGFQGGTSVAELQGIARAAIARAGK